jgi:hypothetical protein
VLCVFYTDFPPLSEGIRRYLWNFKLYWMAVNNMQLPLPRLMVRIRVFFFFFPPYVGKYRKISRIHNLKHIFPKYSQYFVIFFTEIVKKNHWSGCTLLYIQMSDISKSCKFQIWFNPYLAIMCVHILKKTYNLIRLVISQYISQCFRRKSIYWEPYW